MFLQNNTIQYITNTHAYPTAVAIVIVIATI